MTNDENPCQTFFDLFTQDSTKVERLQLQGDCSDWEQLTASRYSPHPVREDEILLRLVFNPIHVDEETGSLKPSVVSDVKDKGCSVNRLKLTTVENVINAGKQAALSKNLSAPEKPPRRLIWIASLEVSEIRLIKVSDQKRAFGVYDTALETDRSHADICQLIPEKCKKESRSARLQLFELVNINKRSVD
jgi:hypothetical protein